MKLHRLARIRSERVWARLIGSHLLGAAIRLRLIDERDKRCDREDDSFVRGRTVSPAASS